jgi:outer membrane protein OmpA-like peptidoglycan-associated protein/tetratricopeptide (TPR) repeat protein
MYSIRSVLIFSALFFVLLTPALSQQENRATADEYLKMAEDILSSTKALDDARQILVMAADMDTTYTKANYEAGEAHLLTIQKELAVKYLMRVYRQNPDYRFDLEYWIGKSYQYGRDFDKAIDFYKRYRAKLSAKPNYQGRDRQPLNVVERSIFQCENGRKFVNDPRNFSIVNIGREINSEFDDYGPVLDENEDLILFTTRRKEDNLNQDVFDDNKPWEDIYYAVKEGDKWGFAKNVGPPVNTLTHNATLALSADGKLLFVYTDEIGNGDILLSERQPDGSWSQPRPLPGTINSEDYKESAITISKDEKTIYFTSDRPGGYGGSDLYTATREKNGEWTRVRNLGPKINTMYDEEGPFIDYDQVTLFFSSEGHNSMGGHDVYKATLLDAKKLEWTSPENLGYPINTTDHDLYFIASRDSKRAYYSSFREDGMGYQDIYMITIPDGLKNLPPAGDTTATVAVKKDTATSTPVVVAKTPTEPVKQPVVEEKKPPVKEPVKEPVVEVARKVVPLKYVVSVVESSGRAPLDAKVKLLGSKDNVIVKSRTKSPGVYEFEVTSTEPKDYRLSVEADGYVFQNQIVKIGPASSEGKTISRTIEMTRISVGVTKILRNIYFDFDKATFKTESYNELNKLENMLRQNSTVKVEIGGHTDGVGNSAYNTFLSRKRAEAVKDYLTRKGIDARRVKAVGYGKTKPIASNDDENEGRELNRRVEFKVLQN